MFLTLATLVFFLLATGSSNPIGQDAPKVEVTVYYETMCSTCIRFDTTVLYKTSKELEDIMNLTYVPYGKATTTAMDKGFTFECQHGPNECQGNMIHACAIEFVNNSSLLSEYVYCFMKASSTPFITGESCALGLGLDWSPIKECATGIQGQTLMAQYGEKTHALDPKLVSVPTVELNGSQSNQEALITDLRGSVCMAYTGIQPEACL
eukprot:TRINITY_DN2924_c0_g1_i1.p1 TRINITY_DN2924_c0_g1~~TRINITY_DN2924_c0_g1_i1.p1  ORF type:complete len:208 (-),score=14.61 TRINITY_DN2924_c0_g1_i1:131-754(-)